MLMKRKCLYSNIGYQSNNNRRYFLRDSNDKENIKEKENKYFDKSKKIIEFLKNQFANNFYYFNSKKLNFNFSIRINNIDLSFIN